MISRIRLLFLRTGVLPGHPRLELDECQDHSREVRAGKQRVCRMMKDKDVNEHRADHRAGEHCQSQGGSNRNEAQKTAGDFNGGGEVSKPLAKSDIVEDMYPV